MKQSYIIVSPVTSKGKYRVCASCIGNGERTAFYEVAECPNLTQAELVRSGLALLGQRVPEIEQKVKAA